MAWKKEKKQSAVKGKSSAFLITVILHAALFIATGYFVAMEVIEQKEAKFTAKQIQRPKMKLQKLRMPVKMERKVKRSAPKLNQRVTANARLETKAAEFKMPEISGFGGGGTDLSGAQLGAGNLGFANMQVDVFGAKSKGEKFLFILSVRESMLKDEMGGIPAYSIIKNELSSLIDSLPPTALFNVILSDGWQAKSLFENLTVANQENRTKLRDWLKPLNESKEVYGLKSLENQGIPVVPESCIPIAIDEKDNCAINASLGYANKNGADAVLWLGSDEWMLETTKERYDAFRRGQSIDNLPRAKTGLDIETFGKERWDELVAKAQVMFDTENKERLANNMAVRVLGGTGTWFERSLVEAYFPNERLPEQYDVNKHSYDEGDILDYMKNMTAKHSKTASKKMRFNSIHFIPQVLEENQTEPPSVDRIRAVTRKYRGAFQEIQGLEAIESASSF